MSRKLAMRRTIKLALWAVLVSGLGLISAGCNTVEGAGKDMEAAGEAIQDAAD